MLFAASFLALAGSSLAALVSNGDFNGGLQDWSQQYSQSPVSYSDSMTHSGTSGSALTRTGLTFQAVLDQQIDGTTLNACYLVSVWVYITSPAQGETYSLANVGLTAAWGQGQTYSPNVAGQTQNTWVNYQVAKRASSVPAFQDLILSFYNNLGQI